MCECIWIEGVLNIDLMICIEMLTNYGTLTHIINSVSWSLSNLYVCNFCIIFIKIKMEIFGK